MKCPFCGDDGTQVSDTRSNEEGDVIRRRRRCVRCEKRFTTYERIDLKMPLILKRNGGRVEYDREKISASLRLALRKRPVSPEAVETAIGRIQNRLLACGEAEVASEQVGLMVMGELKQLDKIAYVRFASVYRNFAEVDEFLALVREMQPRRSRKRSTTPEAAENDLFSD